MDRLGRPFSRAWRGLTRTPLFTAVTVLTLGIGIGANAGLFSVVYGILLKPLPFEEPDRLVGVWHTAPGMNIPRLPMGPAFYFTYLDEGRTFDAFGMWVTRSATITGAGEPERVQALAVTNGTLRSVRARPALGRLFAPEDDEPGSPDRVVLTYGYWQRKFGGDNGILGRAITIDGKSREVIGVLPSSFTFLGTNPAMVMPLQFNQAEVFIGNFAYRGIARLKPGVTVEAANADLARMIPHAIERFPLPPGFTMDMVDQVKLGPNVRPLTADVIGNVGQTLWVLLGMAGIILLIACANVANLSLVRAEGRQQETAVRAALGASPRRIAGELLAESVALGLAGGVVGIGVAWAGVRLLVMVAPAGLPRLDEIGIDPQVVAFTGLLSVLTGLLFGLIPVAKFARPRLAALKEGGRGASDSRSRHRTRSGLVIAEIALALVMLVGSGLMIRTFMALRSVDPGFRDPAEVLTFRVTIPEGLIPAAEQVAQLQEQIQRRLEQVPGVVSVGVSSSIAMDGNTDNDPIFVEDFPGLPGQVPVLRHFKWAGPGYTETMGGRLMAGRTLTWEDVQRRRPVVVISENLAREYWKSPGAALGRRIRPTPNDAWREIVGVVGDERDDGVAQPAPAIVYWPLQTADFWDNPVFVQRSVAYAVRSKRPEAEGFIREIQQAVWSVNPSLPLANIQTLDAIRSASMAQTSFVLVMLAIASAVALLLGIVGVYGVVAYIAVQRTREIGIRMALGAQGSDISGLFLRHGLILTGAGLVLGIGAALGLTRLMASLLFGVTATDPLTFGAAACGLGALAMIATWLPVRRAARLDPVRALRTDT